MSDAKAAPSVEDIEAQKRARREKESLTNKAVISELLFVFLPFIVIAITLGHMGGLRTIFFIPEWSIVSAVVAGQAVVRLASGGIGGRGERESIVLFLSLLLVGLLVPVLVVLAIVLTSDHVTVTMAVAQMVLFIIAVLIFWLASWIEIFVRDRSAK